MSPVRVVVCALLLLGAVWWFRSASPTGDDLGRYERLLESQLGEGSVGYGDESSTDARLPRSKSQPHNPALFEDGSWLPGGKPPPRVVGDLGAGGARPIVVFLHGLGESNEGRWAWMQRLAYVDLRASFVCPIAPVRSITSRGGAMASAWFDLKDPADRRPHSLPGFDESRATVQQLLMALLPLGRPVIVAGFSQGAAVAVAAAMSIKSAPYAWGALCLSGYSVPLKVARATVASTRLWAAHGDADASVPLQWGQHSFASLRDVGAKDPQWETFVGVGHWWSERHEAVVERMIAAASSSMD